jgi:hypothetical protein
MVGQESARRLKNKHGWPTDRARKREKRLAMSREGERRVPPKRRYLLLLLLNFFFIFSSWLEPCLGWVPPPAMCEGTPPAVWGKKEGRKRGKKGGGEGEGVTEEKKTSEEEEKGEKEGREERQ